MADTSFTQIGSGAIPNPISSITDLITKTSPASTGNNNNQKIDDFAQLTAIAAKAQTFISTSLMGRGLTVSRFSASNIGSHWSTYYPYRFLVTIVNNVGHHSVIAEYRLPISPQNLTITSPFAIKTSVTSGGILEEHNGTPLKRIALAGTTGIYIERQTGDRDQKSTNLIGSIFSGTLAAASNAVQQVKLAASAVGIGSASPFASNSAEPDGAALTGTGYYQFQMLDLFLHTYVEAKKAAGNQNMRLIFEIAKDNVQYIVTPVNFTKRRDVSSPMEYFYNIELLAWATVADYAGNQLSAVTASFLNADVDQLHKILNTLTQFRKTVAAFSNVITAAKADVQTNIFGPMNQVIMLLKSIIGIPITVADLPSSIQTSYQSSIVANWNSLIAANQQLDATYGQQIQNIVQQGSGSAAYIGSPSVNNTAVTTYKSSVLNNIGLTDSVDVNQLQLSNTQQQALQNAVNSANSITENDVNNLITNLNQLSTALEPQISTIDALEDEWDILYGINDSIGGLYGIISNGQLSNSNTQTQDSSDPYLATTAMAFWTESTQADGIPFTTPNSKFSVPFPSGGTLEQLASIYLGDPTRWMEIAALNGLQYPYVDEDGFSYSLIENGLNNQINVGSNVNLYEGQTIFISSNTQLVTQRTIKAISQVTSTNFIITVDGASNMTLYTVADAAQIHAYLPYTIRSMNQIYIPSDAPSNTDDLETPILTFLNEDLDLVKFSKIDWLLDQYGDLSVTKNGFFNLAFGKTNLIQAATMKLITPNGSLQLYPSYGAGINVGDSMADLNLNAIAQNINNAFTADARFLAPSRIQLNAQPGVIIEQVDAVVAQQNSILPIVLPLSK